MGWMKFKYIYLFVCFDESVFYPPNHLREAVKYCFSDFVRRRGTPLVRGIKDCGDHGQRTKDILGGSKSWGPDKKIAKV